MSSETAALAAPVIATVCALALHVAGLPAYNTIGAIGAFTWATTTLYILTTTQPARVSS